MVVLRVSLLALLTAVLGACPSSSKPDSRSAHSPQLAARKTAPARRTASPRAEAPLRLALELPGLSGVSGATYHQRKLWLVTERKRKLVEVDPTTLATRSFAIEGVDDNVDLESITRLPSGQFLLGTEINEFKGSPGEGRSVIILKAIIEGSTLRVQSEWPVRYKNWNIRGRENQGIEGLCHVGTTVIAGIESTVVKDGKRVAPLVVLPEDGARVPFWLELTTEAGKLSALDCHKSAAGIELVAIERHFGVARILKAAVPTKAQAVIKPQVIRDLDAFAKETKLNIEGIARIRDHYYLINDNEWKTISGPNELIKVPR